MAGKLVEGQALKGMREKGYMRPRGEGTWEGANGGQEQGGLSAGLDSKQEFVFVYYFLDHFMARVCCHAALSFYGGLQDSYN